MATKNIKDEPPKLNLTQQEECFRTATEITAAFAAGKCKRELIPECFTQCFEVLKTFTDGAKHLPVDANTLRIVVAYASSENGKNALDVVNLLRAMFAAISKVKRELPKPASRSLSL